MTIVHKGFSGPRLSIISGAAATDERLVGNDLKVLCLLGRHIDTKGWCRRSQVKMANELKCARSTVQRSLDRLYESGYVEYYAEIGENGRTAAHWYRVKLDAEICNPQKTANEEGGCPSAGTPAASAGTPAASAGTPAASAGTPAASAGTPAHPWAGTPCPSMGGHLLTTPFNEDSPNPKNAEPADEAEPQPADKAGWGSPTPAQQGQPDKPQPPDDPDFETFKKAFGQPEANWDRAKRKWKTIKPADRLLALASAENYRRQCAASREKQIAPASFLDRRGKMEKHRGVETVTLDHWGRGWWAWLFKRIENGERVGFSWSRACKFGDPKTENIAAKDAPSEDDRMAMVKVAYVSDQGRAWSDWLEANGLRMPQFGKANAVWLWMPSEWPPELTSQADDAAKPAGKAA